MRALRLVGVALATLRVIDTLKEGLPFQADPALKSTVTIAVAAGLSYTQADNWRDRLLMAGAAAGLASVIHDAQWLARVAADSYVTGITRAAARGRAAVG